MVYTDTNGNGTAAADVDADVHWMPLTTVMTRIMFSLYRCQFNFLHQTQIKPLRIRHLFQCKAVLFDSFVTVI